jgi:hypothetical protein
MRSRKFDFSLVFGIFGAILAFALMPSAIQAHASDFPPRPTDVMPPRPTEVMPSRPAPSPVLSEPGTSPEGYIELHIRSIHANLWTVVQWQDHSGRWHDVEGWRGAPDEVVSGEGKKVWWVGKADLGTGPFRWLIYQSQKGKLLAQSQPFYLPHLSGETVKVEVSLTP